MHQYAELKEKHQNEYAWERDHLVEHKPLIFRPSTHYFQHKRKEEECRKQKLFQRAHDHQQDAESQLKKDKKVYDDKVEAKVQLLLSSLAHCQKQERLSLETKHKARLDEINKMYMKDREAHCRRGDVLLADLINMQAREFAQKDHNYSVVHNTHSACDFDLDATRTHERKVNISDIGGLS